MPLISLDPIIDLQEKNRFALGAFNVNSDAQIKAAIEIHDIYRAPALLQGAELANGYMGGRPDFQNSTLEDKKKGAKIIGDAVRKYAAEASIPVILHLDHGKSLDSCKAAIDGGYTSVMIDASHLPFEDNVELTREVVKYAKPFGVTVEGELGVLAGTEDHITSETSTYTNPIKAIEFFEKTGVDALAISYGTMHGPSKGKNVKLRNEIIIAIKECMYRENIRGMLVSHGSSQVPAYIVEEINRLGGEVSDAHGIPTAALQQAIKYGIGKINVDTDIRLAVTRNMREFFVLHPEKAQSPSLAPIYKLLEENKSQIDPRFFLTPVMDTVMYGTTSDSDLNALMQVVEKGTKEIMGTLIAHFGSYGKADLIK